MNAKYYLKSIIHGMNECSMISYWQHSILNFLHGKSNSPWPAKDDEPG